MKGKILAFIIGVVSVFAPIKAALATVFILVCADLILGVIAAKKRGEKITSRALRRTVTKLFVYESSILLAFLAQTHLMGDALPLTNIINSFIGLTEIKSVMENLNSISGGTLLSALIDKLNNNSKK